MISFDAGTRRFNLRAAAIVLNGSQVLLHQLEGDAFWAFPGGRVDGGELASAAVERELREELAEPVTCGELVWVVENFFRYRGVSQHEVGLYFSVRLAPESRLLASSGPFTGMEGSVPLTFAWFERSQLEQLEIRPSFVAAALAGAELGFRHIVHRDDDVAGGVS
jgi:8-oxo-dGTP pyrophosphatase MutT (NUDIX family)